MASVRGLARIPNRSGATKATVPLFLGQRIGVPRLREVLNDLSIQKRLCESVSDLKVAPPFYGSCRISTRIPIAVAVICNGPSQVLIGRRGPDGPLAGYWEFPGGKVEPDESYEQAVTRETCEETGLQIEVVQELLPVDFDYDHGKVALRFFECRLCDVSAETPHGGFRWVDRATLSDYRFPPANDALIRWLEDSAE